MGLEDIILAFRRDEIPQEWLLQNSAVRDEQFIEKLNRLVPFYEVRRELETDNTFKQPIPYLIIRKNDGKIACFTRKGNEKRLHGLWSCGIGGHVDFSDKGKINSETIQVALQREMAEELCGYNSVSEPIFLGIINEEETAVGKVHLGFVFILKVKEVEGLPIAGEEIGELHWKTLEEIKKLDTEIWTQLVVELVAKSNV